MRVGVQLSWVGSLSRRRNDTERGCGIGAWLWVIAVDGGAGPEGTAFAETCVSPDPEGAGHFGKGHGLVRKGGQKSRRSLQIIAHQADFRVSSMCRALRVSRSGFDAWIKENRNFGRDRDDPLLKAIRRIHAALRQEGWQVNGKRVARLMREHGIRGAGGRRDLVTTRQDLEASPAADRVERCCTATAMNRLWVSDATDLPTDQGTLDLAVVQDVFSRRVVGRSMAERQRADLMTTALDMALRTRRPGRGVIHHSDRGSQYTSKAFQQLCERHGVEPSMGSAGDCYDNAMAETFFATLERELIDRQPSRRFASRSDARAKVFDYVEGF